jgi:hypothetical protein
LENVSRDERKDDNSEFKKLNEIIEIIEKNGNNFIQENKDKEYIIQTIKEIMKNKKSKSDNSAIQILDKYEAN